MGLMRGEWPPENTGRQRAVTASPHLTRERRVEVPVTPTSVNLTEGGSQAQSLPLTVAGKNATLSIFLQLRKMVPVPVEPRSGSTALSAVCTVHLRGLASSEMLPRLI